jgi:pimeloyl-ACP methyl ester carboxylesterase
MPLFTDEGVKAMKKASLIVVLLAVLLASCIKQTVEPTPQKITQEVVQTNTPIPPLPTQTPSPTSTIAPTDIPEAVVEPTEEPNTSFEPGSCPFDVPAGVNVECGYVVVPEDHTNLDGKTIRLAVAVIKDQSEENQPDPVIVLAGGPGEKVMENGQIMLQLFGDIHPNRDLIIFDQRGVGLSEPALECPEWVEAQYELLDEADELVVVETSFNKLMECNQKLVSEGMNLLVYNTTQSAADVNAIREALGYEQLNLFGGSYGSFLAQAVVREYPDMVRSVAMNSIYPLEISFLVESPLVTSQGALDLLAACENDEVCNQAYPDLTEVFFETIERLNEEPVMIKVTHAVSGKEYDVLLSGDRVYGNLLGFMYITQFIPLLPQAIYDVYNGDYDLMAQLQGTYLSLYEATSRGMMFSVLCTEDLIGKVWEDLKANYEAVRIPLSDNVDPEETKPYSIFATCEGWGVEEADPSFKAPLVSDKPTLLLGGEFDPVTPIEFAESVAETLSNSYLFEFEGVGHNIMAASDCARKTMGEFFEDPTQPPQASCMIDLEGGFAVPYADPQGMYTFPVPPRWQVVEGESYARLQSPKQDVTAYVVVIEGDDFEAAAESAWAIVDPDFEGQPNILERPCQGCTSAGADKFALIPFDTGDVKDFVLGAGWIYDGQTYMTLWVTDQTTIETQGEMVNTVLIGFEITALEAAEAAEPPEPDSGKETETSGEVNLVPFSNETFGTSGLIPEGWSEISPGIYARSSSAADETVLLQQAAPATAEQLFNLLLEQLGIPEVPESSAERDANGLTWQLYTLETGGVYRDVAVAENEGVAFMVVLRSDASEHDELFETVFLPVVDALVLAD